MAEKIKTVFIQPTAEMPKDVFLRCHHFSFFAELMERDSEGLVIWDEAATALYSESLAEAEYFGLQQGFFCPILEVPINWFCSEPEESEVAHG